MEEEDIAPNKDIQLIQSVWAESRASTQYSSIEYRHDLLPMPTGSAVCIFGAIFSSFTLRPILQYIQLIILWSAPSFTLLN